MTDPTSRILSLLGLLESRDCRTGAQLAERLGVTPRTLRRDVDKLRNLGYVVQAEAGPGGGYILGRGEVLPPLLLDDEQAFVVTAALLRVANSGNGEEAEAAMSALSTLDGLLPTTVRQRLTAVHTAAAFSSPSDALDIGVLLPCAEAIRRQVRLEFSYRDRKGMLTERRVEPHRLVSRGRNWLLLAFDLHRKDWRTFRADRITAPKIGTWHFQERADVSEALQRLAEPVPVTAWEHQVIVHIHATCDEVVAAAPRLNQYVRPLDAATTLFATGADDPHAAAHWLSAIPFDFTVIGDEAVIAATHELGERLSKAATMISRS
ncbi:YafY family protein [Corynebacterium sp. H127]|uniref:helix-turn-helix transcriptional regulator n=1 Tax=Corynebacterium sp. H127 TaxID=3133418 RepID=UPI0030965ED0